MVRRLLKRMEVNLTGKAKPPIMNYRRENRSFTMHISATPGRVFPMLCPVREYEWIETWGCEMIYSRSGHAELDCIFRTRAGNLEDIWEVSRYQPDEIIEFVVYSAFRLMRYQFKLSPEGKGSTKIEVEQVATALRKDGENHVDYPQFTLHMKTLEVMLNHFLPTGKMISDHGASKLVHQESTDS